MIFIVFRIKNEKHFLAVFIWHKLVDILSVKNFIVEKLWTRIENKKYIKVAFTNSMFSVLLIGIYPTKVLWHKINLYFLCMVLLKIKIGQYKMLPLHTINSVAHCTSTVTGWNLLPRVCKVILLSRNLVCQDDL